MIAALQRIRPAAGAAVMATGIVSLSLSVDGHRFASRVLLGVAVVLWAIITTATTARVIRERRDPITLTGVAGTCVVGTCLAGIGLRGEATALLASALVLWLLLMPRVLHALAHRVEGSAFLLVVATEAPAVLALGLGVRWLIWPSAALIVVGLGLYPGVARRFDLGELRRGRGDQWVAGGALAIASLAAAELAGRAAGAVAGPAALVLWLMAAAWIPALVLGEIAAPRRGFDTRRWATVFPLGMYAVAGARAGAVQGAAWLARTGHVFGWVAVLAWAATAVAAVPRAAR